LVDVIREAMPSARAEAGASSDQPTIFVAREALVEVCRALRDRPDLRFQFLADVTAVDWYPREPRFEVVYILASLGLEGLDPAGRAGLSGPPSKKRLRLKVRVPGDDPRLPSVAPVWPSAGWAEREVFDLFGILFDGHPDLRRILMPEDWEGYPMRKDYPVQIRMAAKTQAPLQLSPEQFAANVRAERER
ncbi:MAG: NADH-quinone oxidoreductase subunit C, partial [Vicinamibacterales bacterium]